MITRTTYEEQNLQQTVALHDPFTLERYAQFGKHLPDPCHNVLDVGCANGRGGEVLKQACPTMKLHGLDCVEERLAQLPASYDGRTLGMSTSIPLEDRSMDAVTAGEFLEHLYPIDVDPTLCEFQRILRIGGRLLMTTPHPGYLRNKLQKSSVYGISHLTQHYPKILKTRLLMHGFSRVRIIGSGRVTRYLGTHFPLFNVYGSYLITADKI